MNAPVKHRADDVMFLRPTLYARQVADMLGFSEAYFLDRRASLEAEHGFPGKLPGLNRYSRAAVLRWIETNGRTYLPAEPETDPVGVLGLSIRDLEKEYSQ